MNSSHESLKFFTVEHLAYVVIEEKLKYMGQICKKKKKRVKRVKKYMLKKLPFFPSVKIDSFMRDSPKNIETQSWNNL